MSTLDKYRNILIEKGETSIAERFEKENNLEIRMEEKAK